MAESHPKVKAYVKNHNLGLEVPYRYGSETRKYIPDFIVLVDDGVATGATMRAGIATLRRLGAKHIIVAVPVAPSDTVRLLREEGAEVVCLATPSPFRAVGQWYAVFDQVADEEVRELLADVWTAGDDELGNSRGEGA